MKSEGLLKQIAIVFAITVAIYLAVFGIIEHTRASRGPWIVNFRSDAAGTPSLVVRQSTLNLSNIVFVFPGEKIQRTNLDETVVFDLPTKPVPFGKVVFIDTTFLPGTVTFVLFGHEIELLPRILSVDLKEVPWQSNATIELKMQEKLPPEALIPKKKKRF